MSNYGLTKRRKAVSMAHMDTDVSAYMDADHEAAELDKAAAALRESAHIVKELSARVHLDKRTPILEAAALGRASRTARSAANTLGRLRKEWEISREDTR